MSVSVELISGPSVSDFTRSAAEEGLRRHAAVAAGAPYALEQLEGRWVAAIVHQAGPPFGGGDEGPPSPPAGPDDSAPSPDGPPSDDGDDSGASSSDSGGPSGDSGGGDSDGDKSKGKGGEKHELTALMGIVQQIAQALGIPMDPLGGDPMGGDPMGGDPMGGPPGAGGPPPGAGGPPGAPPHGGPPGAGGPGGPQQVMHMKSLKPGEVPPGATPASAPAFSSVRPTHPWADVIGKTASFHVSSPIGDAPLVDVEAELQSLASEVGHRVTRFAEGRNDSGQRVATAVITQH